MPPRKKRGSAAVEFVKDAGGVLAHPIHQNTITIKRIGKEEIIVSSTVWCEGENVAISKRVLLLPGEELRLIGYLRSA